MSMDDFQESAYAFRQLRLMPKPVIEPEPPKPVTFWAWLKNILWGT